MSRPILPPPARSSCHSSRHSSPYRLLHAGPTPAPCNTGSPRRGPRQTWAQTYARCRRLASSLQRRGIGRNDTVAVMLPNTPAMVEAHFGIPMAGAVLNTLNTRLDAPTLAFMLDHGEAKAVFVDAEYAALMAEAIKLR